MGIKIEKLANGINVESMEIKPAKGETDDGVNNSKDELQLKILNTSNRIYSKLDCKVEYRNSNGRVLGYDSGQTLNALKPDESCLLSFPLKEPVETTNSILTITGAKGISSKYVIGAIISALIIVTTMNWFGA